MTNFKRVYSITTFIVLLSTTALFGQSPKAEHDWLKKMVGKWQVKMIIQPTVDGSKIKIDSVLANRELVGDYCLHEVMYPQKSIAGTDFKRLSDLAFNVNESRWDYISIDTRITAGIMNFTFLSQQGNTITWFISSFPHPGFGKDLSDRGRSVYMRNVFVRIDDDHNRVLQYWRLTDQKEWLAVQYDYTRIN